ncbi:major facilitator superfamily domain-containing protein [Dactylonectria macrodidyma]|uniref:Major facilitator superfamily domain-containing protein n=1 Tax=Dactylonectria macrodidyma TaxID=307937 RepID=A0A9P9J8D2_9HYPO|nr:major facilitator superfamily domain-containing protein [Dactylonectria macrodidyma]
MHDEKADAGSTHPTQTVDTVHKDEALRVLQAYDGDEAWTDKEEKKLRRKIDWRLMPVLCVTYGLQYYDKAMLGQAAIFDLRTDLGLETGNRYAFSAAIFYLGFIVGAYPAMMLAQRYPIERVASGIVTVWGICLILTTVCKDYKALYTQRFFLGLLESGISPMFMLIVGSFYKKNEQAMRMGIWYSCTGYVSIFSPLVNYGLGLINGGVSSWRYMYYFAGSITIVWGILLYFVLPPDPVRARGFNERERYILVARLRTNNSGVRNTHLKVSQIWELLVDMKFWVVFAIAFLSMIANGPISTFVPIIINGFGFTTLNSLLLMMPCGAYAGTLQLIMPYLAYRYKNVRSYLVLVAQLGTTLAALLLWLLPQSATGGLLFAVYILPSVGGGYAVLMGLQIANTAGYTKRSVASSGLYIGYCLGNFVGPLVFKKEDAPRYVPGFIVVVVTAVVAGALAIVYRLLCMWTNRKRDNSGIMEGFDHAYEDDLTDVKKPPTIGSASPLISRNESALSSSASSATPRRSSAICRQLQSRNRQGQTQCSNCEGQDQDCHLRPSKRGKQRHRARSQYDGEGQLELPDPTGAILGNHGSDQPILPSPSATHGSEIRVAFTAPASGPRPAPGPRQLTQTSTSPTEGAGRSHAGDVDTGFLQVYGPENQLDAEQQELVASLDVGNSLLDARQQELQQSFSETYFEYCYPWCPVLDRQTLEADLARSPMLANALALAASHIQPPLVQHEGPAAYYQKARMLFYNDEEADVLTALRAISLFYWWAPRPPSTAHRHASWWWTSVIIRHAQQMNIHREPAGEDSRIHLSLRRRLWWTVFARERLTSLCQSKPCIICPEDMSILEAQPSDFPSDSASQKKGRVFVYWVRLCAIIGKVSKVLSQSSSSTSAPFPTELRQELVEWAQSLPPELQLPIRSSRTASFDRDVHQLYLPYLTTVIIIHLQRTAPDLPQALPPAILAASCIARILRDILSRGNARFLMAITCWYCGTAFIALLQASRIKQFSQEAEEGLDILDQAVGQLQQMWASANVIRQGFERLRSLPRTMVQSGRPKPSDQASSLVDPHLQHQNGDENSSPGEFDWTLLFPFVTRSTSRIADCLLADREFGTTTTALPSPENAVFHEDLLNRYQDLLEPFVDYTFDFSTLDFETL